MSVSSPVAVASSPIRSSPLGPNRGRYPPPPSSSQPSFFSSPSHSNFHPGSYNPNFRAGGPSSRSHGPPPTRRFPASSPSTRHSSRPNYRSNRSDMHTFSPSPVLARSTSTSSSSLGTGGFFNPKPDHRLEENGLGLTSVTKTLWRDKFRARCADRVMADKKKALGRRRFDIGSSEASDGEGMILDGDRDDGEDEEDEFEQEIFRRIMRSQEARRQKEFTRSSTSIGIPLEALLEDEIREAWEENTQEMEGMEEEIEMEEEVDEFDPEYLEYLLDQGCATPGDTLDSVETGSISGQMSIEPPLCPQCPPPNIQTELRHRPQRLTPQPHHSLGCTTCGFVLPSWVISQIEQAWHVDGHAQGQEGQKTSESHPEGHHAPFISLSPPEAGFGPICFCSAPGCDWCCSLG